MKGIALKHCYRLVSLLVIGAWSAQLSAAGSADDRVDSGQAAVAIPAANVAAADNATANAAHNPAAYADKVTTLYDSASWVAQVRVTQVRQRVNVALSQPGMYVLDGFVYNLAVLKQWKGDGQNHAVLDVAVKDCPSMMLYDGEYIVFGEGLSQGLRASSCEQQIPYAADGQEIAILDQLYSRSLASVSNP